MEHVLAQSLGRFGKSRVGVTFPDRAAGQPSQMIGAVGAQTRPKFEFCARPKCTDWTRILGAQIDMGLFFLRYFGHILPGSS